MRKIDGRSPLVTPPGTEPAAAGAAGAAAVADRAAPAAAAGGGASVAVGRAGARQRVGVGDVERRRASARPA